MTNVLRPYLLRSTAIFLVAGLLIVGFGGASLVGPLPEPPVVRSFVLDTNATQSLREMTRLGFNSRLSQQTTDELLTYLANNSKTLAQVLQDPVWQKKLGFSADNYKATWYAANPYELLPVDLQLAIRKVKAPFRTRVEVNSWLKAINASTHWREAVRLALIETTPINLWRASRGKKPYAKNGQYLQPLVVEKDKGLFDVRDGHIATDPRFIPTNSRVLVIVKINGEERVLKAKAADIGGAIKGRHVDLPISMRPRYTKNHSLIFPGDYIRNPTVLILRLDPKK